MTVTLGNSPESMRLVLTPGADFICTLVSSDGDWPITATITIEVGDIEWAAVIVGDEARFEVDQVDVDTAIATNPRRFRLWYVDGDTRLMWGAGLVGVTNV